MTMLAERWNYIKTLNPSPGQMFHVSKRYIAQEHPKTGVRYYAPLPGLTYQAGKNKAKRNPI